MDSVYPSGIYLPPHKRRRLEEMSAMGNNSSSDTSQSYNQWQATSKQEYSERPEPSHHSEHAGQDGLSGYGSASSTLGENHGTDSSTGPSYPPVDSSSPREPTQDIAHREDVHKDLKPAAQEGAEEITHHEALEQQSTEMTHDSSRKAFLVAQPTLNKDQEEGTLIDEDTFQRKSFIKLAYDLQGLVNKASVSNVVNIAKEIFKLNLIRGRGLFCKMIIKAQQGHGTMFTPVYAAIVAVVNTKFPEIGELLLHRLLLQFLHALQEERFEVCKNLLKFIAHLVNQQVAHVVLAGQICGLLLEKPSPDAVELCVGFILECGKTITDNAPKIAYAIFESFRSILVSGKVERKTRYMIERLFRVRQEEFADFPGVTPELDLVEMEDQITHEVELEDDLDAQEELDEYTFDEDFDEHEERYEEIRREILGDEDEAEEEDEPIEEEEEKVEKTQDKTFNLLDVSNIEVQKFKRDVYLMFVSSLDHEECAFKILKSGMAEGKTYELCWMIISSCIEERAYNKFYGLLGERFCLLDRKYQEAFEECFRNHYTNIDDTDISKIRNLARIFAHLLESDVLSWTVLSIIRISVDSISMAARIFVKILFQEIVEKMGMRKLLIRLKDPYLVSSLEGLFPIDNPKNTKFAIRFWKSCGLEELAVDLEKYLELAPKELFESDSDEEEETKEEE